MGLKIKSNKGKINSNKLSCFYCGNELEGVRRFFCSDVCVEKYWAGVYSKKWKEGSFDVRIDDKPTKKDIEKAKEKNQARKLACKIFDSKETLECELCDKLLTKSKIIRHHEDYSKPDVFMVICIKCHGWVKRYNNLKNRLYLHNMKGGKK